MVQVRDNDFLQDGEYTIGLEGIKPASPGTTTFILGTKVSRTISTALQKDQWLAEVPPGKVLAMSLSRDAALDPGFNISADVYNSAGVKLKVASAGTYKWTFSSGLYLFQIRDASLINRGSYKLRIWLEKLKWKRFESIFWVGRIICH